MSVLKNLNLHRKLLLIVGWAALSMVLLIALSLYNRWQQTQEEPKTLALSLVETLTASSTAIRDRNKPAR
jgi:hypothetical protein